MMRLAISGVRCTRHQSSHDEIQFLEEFTFVEIQIALFSLSNKFVVLELRFAFNSTHWSQPDFDKLVLAYRLEKRFTARRR